MTLLINPSYTETHVSLDLETLSTEPNACILAIGACLITPRLGAEDAEVDTHFYQVVDVENTPKELLGDISISTVLWWMQQSEGAREAITKANKENKVTLPRALHNFSLWLEQLSDKNKKGIRIWGSGAAFDNVVLTSAYSSCNMERPWTYSGDRCYRTVKAIYSRCPADEQPNLVAHNALHDAIYQARHLVKINEGIKHGKL